VFREDPISADFVERFVSLFDAAIEDLDRVIERFPALIDPATAPAEALPWLGTFLDIALDPAWPLATRRALLAEAPALYRHRGTPRALARAIELVTGLRPAIRELGGATGPFGRLGGGRAPSAGARLGELRLFGRARARLRLGASALGAAALRSHGDPDRDHLAAIGWRIAVQIPGGQDASPEALERLRRLIDAQKPAHVTAAVRVGERRVLVGVASAVGIDTQLLGVPASYLGTNTLLRRRTVLARGARRGGASLAVGTSSAVAIQTVLS
jgi:phage tail-like protein